MEYTMKIVHTHETHIEYLREILLLKKQLHILGSRLETQEYDYKGAIGYFREMFGYLDAHRIIFYGVKELSSHIELQRLLLKNTSYYLGDEPLFVAVSDLLSTMGGFLAEFTYDPTRHFIGHIGWQGVDGHPTEENAYHIQQTNSFHIFLQFIQYIIEAIKAYITLKQKEATLLTSLPSEKSQDSTESLYHEIQAFEVLQQEMEDVVNTVTEVCETETAFETRKEMLQEYCVKNRLEDGHILHGIAHIHG